MDDKVLETLSLSTQSGIITSTVVLTEIVKRMLSNVTWLQKVPLFVYSCSIAALLAFLANRVIYVDGHPLLAGSNVWIAMWKSILGAASASGFYSWFKDAHTPETATRDTSMKAKNLMLLLPLLFLVGCTAPQHVTFREAVAPLGQTALDENADLADRIANSKPLPKFNAQDAQLRRDARDKFRQLVDQDRLVK